MTDRQKMAAAMALYAAGNIVGLVAGYAAGKQSAPPCAAITVEAEQPIYGPFNPDDTASIKRLLRIACDREELRRLDLSDPRYDTVAEVKAVLAEKCP